MAFPQWQNDLANELARICFEENIPHEDRDAIRARLHKHADEFDRKQEKGEDRWGSAWVIDNYKPPAQNRFLSIVQDRLWRLQKPEEVEPYEKAVAEAAEKAEKRRSERAASGEPTGFGARTFEQPWVKELAAELARICFEEKIPSTDLEAVRARLVKHADEWDRAHWDERLGSAYVVDNYKPATQNRFLAIVQDLIWRKEKPEEAAAQDKSAEEARQREETAPTSEATSSGAEENGEIHKPLGKTCALSIKLKPHTKLEGLQESITKLIDDAKYPGVKVLGFKALNGDWVDLLIEHGNQVTQVYESVFSHKSVSDVVSKPSDDFGKVTEALQSV